MAKDESTRGSEAKLLGEVFARFIKASPISVMARGVLENALSAEALDELFAAKAERQYVRELLFSALVNLMSLVVFRIRPSVHAAYQAMKDDVAVSVTAIYDKLDRFEPGLASALTEHTHERLAPVVEAMGGQFEPPVPRYRLRILDGNHLAATERRLKVLRGSKAGPLPGHRRSLRFLEHRGRHVEPAPGTAGGNAYVLRNNGERGALAPCFPRDVHFQKTGS